MLSRVALRSVRSQLVQPLAVRATSTDASGVRDEKNFPRPVRGEPGKVRLGFIPEEWFLFFHKKTGVTGPYAFGVGLVTYLCSKEIYVMEHEYYGGLSLLIMIIFATKKFGKNIAAFLDKEVDAVAEDYNSSRQGNIQSLKESINMEKKSQEYAKGQELLMQAKKDNVLLQLEGAYRERLMLAYREVKRRLDYQVEKANVDRRISQKHMVDWIVLNVKKAITPDQEKQTLNKCIADLAAMAAKTR